MCLGTTTWGRPYKYIRLAFWPMRFAHTAFMAGLSAIRPANDYIHLLLKQLRRIMNRLLKFVSFFIACLYPSIAMAEPLLGDFILQLFSLFLFVPISIFVIWLLPYAKMSSYPELTGLYIFNTFIDALVLLYCVNSGSTGYFFIFFIIPIMLIKLFMYLKKSNSIKQKH